MSNDPYSLCPCGVGTKRKWCTAKEGMTQLDHAISMIRNNQQDASLALLEKLSADETQPECFRIYADCVRSQALDMFGQPEEAIKLAEENTQRHPESGAAWETLGDFAFAAHDYATALDIYENAIAHIPPEATDQVLRTLLKLGTCHNFQGRPLAAWAEWSRALKVQPGFKPALESLEQFIHQNMLLPNPARHGMSLKSADEFTLFDEDVGEQWEKAAKDGDALHVDDLVMTFSALTGKDPNNAAAWYNLGLSCAWAGLNLRAIEAFSKYVELEKDLSVAADAWDLAEVLRLGAGAEEVSDNLLHVAVYEIVDPQSFVQRLQSTKHVLVLGGQDGQRTLHWMDKEMNPQDAGVPILGGPPRQLAQINAVGPLLEVVATTAEHLREVQSKFDPVLGDSVRFEAIHTRPGNPSTLDSEPFMVFDNRPTTDEERAASLLDSVRKYFEETWLQRPLRSLEGASPIDAAQSPTLRKKLEGVIRYRERNMGRYGVPYNFDRLRNKLSLPISGTGLSEEEGSSASPNVDFSAYSAAQLAGLDPAKLSDEELVHAYKAAVNLDVPQTTLAFAEQLASREGAAGLVDMNVVHRRLINDRLASRKTDELPALIDRAREFDARHYQSREAATFELLQAKAAILAGNKEEGLATMRSLPEKHPDRLDVAASAVESLLSAGEYQTAKDLADIGLQRAEEGRDKDFQARFREYAREATSRS